MYYTVFQKLEVQHCNCHSPFLEKSSPDSSYCGAYGGKVGIQLKSAPYSVPSLQFNSKFWSHCLWYFKKQVPKPESLKKQSRDLPTNLFNTKAPLGENLE